MSTGPTESPAPIQTTPTTAPNPIPSLPASAPIQPPVNPFAIATPIYQDAAVIPASKEEPPASAPAEAPAPAAILDAPPLEAPPTALSQPLSAAKETPSAPLAPSGVQSRAANRRLAPRTAVTTKPTETADSAAPRKFPFSLKLNSLESFSTAGAGLAIVVGLFLTSAWLLRRGSPKPGGLLPPEAFAVLGRSPLTPQSIAHLLRIGNKLVLVAVSADGAQPLTEITDPLEVDRLTGLCASGRGHGPAAEFQQVLAQLAKEPARGFLGSEASSGRRR
jgi:flagellar biogenesis protein FliO